MATKTASDGGTILRGPDGALYFVRDELLDALKVENEGLERLQETMKGAKGTASTGSLKPIGYVKGSLLRQDPRNQGASAQKAKRATARASTIMCPWFC